MGTRLARLIQEKLKNTGGEHILFGGLSSSGGNVYLEESNDQINFRIGQVRRKIKKVSYQKYYSLGVQSLIWLCR